MPQYVLGVHDGHNSAAALVRDGEILYAVQEERLVNQKNYYGFPHQAVKAALAHGGIGPSDVSQLALVTMRRTPPGRRTTDQAYAARRDASLWGFFRRTCLWYPAYRFNPNLGWSERLAEIQRAGFSEKQVQRYVHHLGHAATAYYCMRQNPHDKHLVVTMDGSGDLECCTVWIGEAGRMTQIASTPLGNSLGSIYAMVTGQMGFVPLEHEYKLMGMAPYASEKYAQSAADAFRALLRVDPQSLRLVRQTPEPTYAFPRRLRRMISGMRFDNVCAGMQVFCEEIIVALVRAAIAKTGIRRVVVAGGVFMNVKGNKRLMELPEVDYLGIPPSCGDESMCFGIAQHAYAQIGGNGANERIAPLGAVYFGPDVTEEDAAKIVKASGHTWKRYDDIESEIAAVLAGGHPVARCKGRMEFGARALGNRSILADPRDQDVVRVINQMIKKRDFWMPFAPVVMRERVQEYFVNPKNFPSPYMMLTFDTHPHNFRDLLAAVHNADLTARAQVIEQQHNPEYYKILKVFSEKTGRGVLLNTSFNLHGLPVVLGPTEAMYVFENSGLTHLAVGQYMVTKPA
ncbi:MAG: hypothetical protein IPM64_03040 [Phycisphaerales bacterium]|nr:hypothetical protein [Phycisphaerales bacterium]